MSALPAAVQKQIDKANEIVDKVYPKKDEDGNIIEPPKAEATPPKKEATPPKKEVEPPTPEPASEPDPDHKYKVLQGKYNAEVPRLQKANQHLSDENSELKQRMLNLEGLVATMQAVNAPPAEPEPALPVVTDDERAQFGDDLIDLVERVAKRATLPEIEAQLKPLEGRVKQVGEKVAHTETSVAESKRRQVFDALTAAVPNWVQQNEDENFLKWLDEVDQFAGRSRGQLLTEAMNALDTERVIAFFKGFQSENAADTSEVTLEPPAGETPPAQEPQPTLDDFVAPGTPKTGTASAPNESGKRVWTRADIASFYADKNEFVKKGKPIPKEMVKLERDIFKAQSEGRLR